MGTFTAELIDNRMQKESVEPGPIISGKLRKVSFKTSDSNLIEADIIRLSPQGAVFQLYTLQNSLRLSEVLTDFQILADKLAVYHGTGVVRSLVELGTMTVCEVELVEVFAGFDFIQPGEVREATQSGFKSLLERWAFYYRILPEYKLVVSDMASYLHEFRFWLDQVELGLSKLSPIERNTAERAIASELSLPTEETVGALFQKYELVASKLPKDTAAAHRAYCRRLIQPLVLSSPFALRAVKKPMGYAGDYELVDMILRDPHEGKSLYGKVLNHWFIKQPPAEAHRNRIAYLTQKLVEETARVKNLGRTTRIFNIGCGPAQEIQRFFDESSLSNYVEFTLLDFNDETLTFAKKVLEQARMRNARQAKMEFARKSAAQLLRMKGGKGEGSVQDKYDFVYCAGLFDYLADSLCKQLTEVFYKMLLPGGLLVVTNVDSSNPIRHWLGDILEWHLIYRDQHELLALSPTSADPCWVRLVADATSANIFLEVRKPTT